MVCGGGTPAPRGIKCPGSAAPGQIGEVLPRHAVDRPLVHGLGGEGEIEVDGGLVPVQAPPLQPSAALLHGDGGQPLEQGQAVALAPVLRADEQILQVYAAAAQEGGEVVEIEGEAHRLVPLLGDEDLCTVAFKDPGPEGVLVGHHLVPELFVLGQVQNELQDEGHIVRDGLADGKELVRLHGGSSLQYIDSGPGRLLCPGAGLRPGIPGGRRLGRSGLGLLLGQKGALPRLVLLLLPLPAVLFLSAAVPETLPLQPRPDEGKDGHEEEGADEPRRGGKVPLQSAHELAGGPAQGAAYVEKEGKPHPAEEQGQGACRAQDDI